MTDEAAQGSRKRGRLAGWILVVLGVLTIVQGSVIPYSPSFTEETWTCIMIYFAASMIIGALLIVFGVWLLLKKKGAGAEPRKRP